jgi:hypothetical protein
MATFRSHNAVLTPASEKPSESLSYFNPPRKSHETIETL